MNYEFFCGPYASMPLTYMYTYIFKYDSLDYLGIASLEKVVEMENFAGIRSNFWSKSLEDPHVAIRQ